MPSAPNVCWAWLFVLEGVEMNLMWSMPRENLCQWNLCLWSHSLPHLCAQSSEDLLYLRWPGLVGIVPPPPGLESFSDICDSDLARRGSSPQCTELSDITLLETTLAVLWREEQPQRWERRDKRGQARAGVTGTLVLSLLTPSFLLFNLSCFKLGFSHNKKLLIESFTGKDKMCMHGSCNICKGS